MKDSEIVAAIENIVRSEIDKLGNAGLQRDADRPDQMRVPRASSGVGTSTGLSVMESLGRLVKNSLFRGRRA